MWCIWALVPKMFSGYAPGCCYLSPTRGSKPWVVFWHYGIATMPPHLHLPPNATKMLHTEQLSVSQINGKTYWTGTIMQTNEITEQLCPYKSASACWQYDASYRANSPLDPGLYQVLNATHHLLTDTNPQLARDCWLCLSLGTPRYLATPVPLNIATAMGTPTDPPLQGPVFFFF